MPVKFEVSVMQVGASLRITIPKEIGKHLSLEKGNLVELWVDNHSIIMEKKMNALKEISTWKKNIPRGTHHNSVTERSDNE